MALAKSLLLESEMMSIDALIWAWKQRTKTATDKLILLSLADRAGEDHTCCPSYDRLIFDTQLNRNTIARGLKRLEEFKLLIRIKRYSASNAYQLIGVEDRHSSMKSGTNDRMKSGTNDRMKSGTNDRMKSGTNDRMKSGTNDRMHIGTLTQREPSIEPKKEDKALSHPPCPHEKIRELYNTVCTSLPKAKMPSDTRKRNMTARWRADTKHQSMEFWQWYFDLVNNTPFLNGSNNRGWSANFDWIIKSGNFVKVIEQQYGGAE